MLIRYETTTCFLVRKDPSKYQMKKITKTKYWKAGVAMMPTLSSIPAWHHNNIQSSVFKMEIPTNSTICLSNSFVRHTTEEHKSRITSFYWKPHVTGGFHSQRASKGKAFPCHGIIMTISMISQPWLKRYCELFLKTSHSITHHLLTWSQ